MTPLAPLVSVLDLARAWPVASQQTARRNAMIACTAMAARRAEREDVDDYMSALHDDRELTPLRHDVANA